MKGERIIKFEDADGDIEVIFDQCSTIQFYRGEDQIMSLDPTNLSILYASYMQMMEEDAKYRTWEKNIP